MIKLGTPLLVFGFWLSIFLTTPAVFGAVSCDSLFVSKGEASFHIDSFNGLNLKIETMADRESGLVEEYEVEGATLPVSGFNIKVTRKGDRPQISWASLNAKDGEANPKISQLLKPYQYFVKNLRSLWPHAAMSFPSAGLSRRHQYAVHLKTNETAKMSRELGEDVWLEQIFTPQSVHDTDWISLQLADFRAVTAGGKVIKDLSLNPQSTIQDIGFSVRSAAAPRASNENFILMISKDFELSVALPDSVNPADFIHINDLNGGFNQMIEYTVGSRTSIHSSFKKSEILPAVRKFFDSMAVRRNQQYAHGVVARGRKAIEKELGQFGIYVHDYTSDSQSSIKLKSAIKDVVHLSDIMTAITRNVMPYETGDFGFVHGPWSHHKQLLAGFKGLDEAEVQIVHAFITSYLAGTPANWPMWNLLFDSHGMSRYSPRYWRD